MRKIINFAPTGTQTTRENSLAPLLSNEIIGEGTTIGMGVNIIDGISIGSNTIIGEGSVVTRHIPDNVIAYGSPCKVIREN